MAKPLNCPSCGGEMQVPDSLLGRQIRCPACRQTFSCTPDGKPIEPPAAAPDPAPESLPVTETPVEPASPPPRFLDDPLSEFLPCSYCAEIIPGHAQFCPFCGERVDPHKR